MIPTQTHIDLNLCVAAASLVVVSAAAVAVLLHCISSLSAALFLIAKQ
jgi:hypothetical protein